jgi:hypothetical protein
VNIETYSEVSVLTKVEAPVNASAMVTIYLDLGEPGELELGHPDSEAASWSRWSQAIAGKRISLVAASPNRPGAVPATQVDVLVYLSPR